MPVTKLAEYLIAEEMRKEANGDPTPGSLADKGLGLTGKVGGAFNTALAPFFIANEVASGESSLGESLAGYGGMSAGFTLGNKLYNKFVPQVTNVPENVKKWLPQKGVKQPWYRPFRSVWEQAKNPGYAAKRWGRGLGGIATGFIVGGIGDWLGRKLMPFDIYKRQSPYADYNYN